MCVGGGILSHLTKQSCSGISSLLRKTFSGTVGRLQELGNFHCNTFPYQEECFFFSRIWTRLQSFFKLQGTIINDALMTFCCGLCETCRMAREVRIRNGDVWASRRSWNQPRVRGTGGGWGTSNSSSPLCRWLRWRVFFNIFNEKYGHILFYWQLRDQPCINPLLCAPIYVFNHSSYEVDNAQFCHSFHDCSPEVLLHFFMLNLKFHTFLFVTLFSSFPPLHLKISHLGPRQY